jgi:hypothetical protein
MISTVLLIEIDSQIQVEYNKFVDFADLKRRVFVRNGGLYGTPGEQPIQLPLDAQIADMVLDINRHCSAVTRRSSCHGHFGTYIVLDERRNVSFQDADSYVLFDFSPDGSAEKLAARLCDDSMRKQFFIHSPHIYMAVHNDDAGKILHERLQEWYGGNHKDVAVEYRFEEDKSMWDYQIFLVSADVSRTKLLEAGDRFLHISSEVFSPLEIMNFNGARVRNIASLHGLFR